MYRVLLMGVSLLVLLLVALVSSFQPLYWLVYASVISVAVGYLWSWLQSRGLETEVHELTPYPQVGQTVHLKVMVREKAGLPRVGLHARLLGDFITLRDEGFNLAPKGSVTWNASGLCSRRGLNEIGSLAIVSGDPSGLLSLECRAGKPQSILVYPSTVDLSRTLVEGQATGGEIGEMGQLVGHSATASMVRPYTPGDSLTHVHWPTTARLDQLMTKEFEGAGINEIWLFLDMQEDAQMGTGEDGTEEYGVTMAASLARALIQDGHAVGLVSQGDQTYRLSPRKDANHLWALQRALALAKAKGRTPLPALMAQETSNLGAGTVAIVLAPWPGQGIGSLFQFLRRRGILVVPIFMDPASFGGSSDPRRPSDGHVNVGEWSYVVKRGDDLSVILGNVLDHISSY